MVVDKQRKDKYIANWLLIGVGMIIFQIILGGITRLTGSGLSITEWKPILGALPPLNESDWQVAFDKYKQLGQFKYINADFTMGQFQFIYFWEWLHRNWARFMALVFLVPFIYFLVRGYITQKMAIYFGGIFILGALQGAVGWIMVASGINPDDLYVSHIKLALHFIAAVLLLVFIYWFALQLSIQQNKSIYNKKLMVYSIIIIALLFVQLSFGALVAGLKAATAAPTWPLMNGEIIPSTFVQKSWLYNPVNVQFIHRSLGYLIALLLIWIALQFYNKVVDKKSLVYPLVLVGVQIILGIGAVLFSVQKLSNAMGKFEWSALFHQLCAIGLLLSLIRLLYLNSRRLDR